MNTKLRQWIDKVAQSDRGLAALLRGLVAVEYQEELVRFIWHSEFHKTTGGKRESEIRPHLGRLRDWPMEHLSLTDWAEEDPMLQEALALGARVKQIDGPQAE